MALKSEIYAEINAHLCGLKHLDKENKYKTQLDELVIQNKNMLLNSLTGDSYFKLIYRANIIEKIEQLYYKFGMVEKFFVDNLYHKNSVAFNFCLENNILPACPDCKQTFLSKPETGKLFCSKCNRIEDADGTAFLPEQQVK